MFIFKICVFLLFIISITVIDGRSLRRRRQAMPKTLSQDVNNFFSNGYNTIRDNVGPAISSTVDRFSQNWDRYKQDINQGFNQGINQGVNQVSQAWGLYKQNLNQGVNQFTQGWNRFSQNFNPQYPKSNSNNYGYNQYGYNNQQYPYPMNYNYNAPPNMYQNYDGRQGNLYPVNNYYNGYGVSRENAPYYTGNMGGQWYQNSGGQPRLSETIVPNSAVYANQRAGPRRR